MVARMMKANARNKGEHEKVRLSHTINATTMEAYSELADKISGRTQSAPEQRRRMQEHKKKVAERREAKIRDTEPDATTDKELRVASATAGGLCNRRLSPTAGLPPTRCK